MPENLHAVILVRLILFRLVVVTHIFVIVVIFLTTPAAFLGNHRLRSSARTRPSPEIHVRLIGVHRLCIIANVTRPRTEIQSQRACCYW